MQHLYIVHNFEVGWLLFRSSKCISCMGIVNKCISCRGIVNKCILCMGIVLGTDCYAEDIHYWEGPLLEVP